MFTIAIPQYPNKAKIQDCYFLQLVKINKRKMLLPRI
jgi:hypothetical protein